MNQMQRRKFYESAVLILRSVGVPACGFGERLAQRFSWRRDAAETRSRDGCATRSKREWLFYFGPLLQ
jgi:hypothetical protein